jgi:cytochrome c
MEFLKTIAMHQPTEHFRLLLFMMNVVFIMLIPYVGFLLGSSALSYYYSRRGRSKGNATQIRFGRMLIDVALATKGLVTFLALVPALSLVFLLAQMLQETPAISVTLMGFAFLSLLTSAVLLYTYRLTFGFGGLLRSYSGLLRQSKNGRPAELEDLAGFTESNERTHRRSGLFGIIFLLLGCGLMAGAITVVGDPVAWSTVDTLFSLLKYAPFWFRLVQFLAIALGVTGVGILFFFFSWNGGLLHGDPEIAAMARRDGLRFAGISIFLQPVLLLVTVATLPPDGLSGTVFGMSGLALVFFFVSAHFVYAFKKERRSGYAASAFYTLILALIFVVTKDQLAISNATREQAVRLALAAERETEELKATLGIASAKPLSGQEIYDAKCSACHLFDARKIGPAYKDVIPKYEGRKAQLIAFVLNPVKVDPAFPSMPNQALRPQEADSIATFILARVTGKPATPQASTK